MVISSSHESIELSVDLNKLQYTFSEFQEKYFINCKKNDNIIK